MEIGQVVSSDSHIIYYGRILDHEIPQAITPADYALGRLVGLSQPDGTIMVGLVTNTQIYNPNFGNPGPRLTRREDAELFTPDYLAEKTTLIQVTAIGTLEPHLVRQGYPLVSSVSDAPIILLADDDIDRFHHPYDNHLVLSYLPLLLASQDPILQRAVAALLNSLIERYPQDADHLRLLINNLAWKTQIEPLL